MTLMKLIYTENKISEYPYQSVSSVFYFFLLTRKRTNKPTN